MWTNEQKALAVRACTAAGISEENRKTILSGPAFENRSIHQGRHTSTAPLLTNSDFEIFMAFVESQFPNQTITVGGRFGDGWSRGYWAAKAADTLSRMRGYAWRIAGELQTAGVMPADGSGLAGWIKTRVCKGQSKTIDQLDFPELNALVRGLKNLAYQRGV